jgi:hypothetical protein
LVQAALFAVPRPWRGAVFAIPDRPPEEPTPETPPPPPPTPEEQACAVWDASWPINGSPAAIYLREAFGITETDCLDCFRWHDLDFALVAASTDENGRVVAVEMLALTEAGKVVDYRFGPDPREPAKKRIGNPLKGAVRLPGPDNTAPFVARTVDEAIAAHLAGYASAATLVPFTFAHLLRVIPPGGLAAICFADDKRNNQWERDESERQRMLAKLMTRGRYVVDVRPYDELRHKGATIADHLRDHGLASLKAWFNELVGPMKFVDPGFRPVQEVRAKLGAYLGSKLEQMINAGGARTVLLDVDCGVGKTTTLRREFPRLVKATQRKTDAIGELFSIYNSAPLHAIHDETLDAVGAMRAESKALDGLMGKSSNETRLFAASRRGRQAYQPHSKDTMCANLGEIERAERLGVPDLGVAVCNQCPYLAGCPYFMQARDAELIMVSHKRMARNLAYSDPFASVVISDEIPLSAYLKPAAIIPLDLLCDEEAMPTYSPRDGSCHHGDLRECLARTAGMNGLGFLRAKHVLASGIDTERARDARTYEIRRSIKPKDDDFSVCRPNLSIAPMRDLWWAIADMLERGDEATGRIEIVEDKRRRRGFRILAVHRRGQRWRAPTMIMAALVDPRLLAPIFGGGIERGPSFLVSLPHARIIATVGRSFVKTSLAPASHARDERKMAAEDLRKERLRDAIEAFSTIVQRVHGGNQMIVGNKATIEALKSKLDQNGRSGVLTGNFNGLVGLNQFERCATGIVIGQGAIPSVRVVEDIAQALTGRVIERVGRNWSRRYENQLFRLPDGRYAAIPRLTIYHPNALVDALLKFFGAYQAYQAVYRLRPGNRTAVDPATIFVLNNLVLPFPIDGLLPITEIFEPSESDRMMAAGGWAFDEATAASKAFADTLYPSRKAAQNRFDNEVKSNSSARWP